MSQLKKRIGVVIDYAPGPDYDEWPAKNSETWVIESRGGWWTGRCQETRMAIDCSTVGSLMSMIVDTEDSPVPSWRTKLWLPRWWWFCAGMVVAMIVMALATQLLGGGR